MTHWMRRVGVGAVPLIVLFSAASAFAANPPTHTALHPARVKPPSTKTAPVKPSAGSQVMLNPQPIPPGKTPTAPVTANGGSKVVLNPQPIPPGKSMSPTKTNGGDKAIIFVGGKSAKPKSKTGSPAIPPGPPAKAG